MSIINTVQNLRAWFLSCPTVNSILKFNADYIGPQSSECSIYTMPSNLRYSEDVVGNITYDVRQVRSFIFSVRMPYGNDVSQNLDNINFFDDVQTWMYTQNTLKNFPTINDGVVKSIMPSKTQYVADADANSVVYNLQFAVAYDRDDV